MLGWPMLGGLSVLETPRRGWGIGAWDGWSQVDAMVVERARIRAHMSLCDVFLGNG